MTDNSRRPRSAAASVPRILALDLMSKLGWACRARDGALMYGIEDFKLKGIESNGLEECIEIVDTALVVERREGRCARL